MFSSLRLRLQQFRARLPASLPSPCALCGGGDTPLCAGCAAQFFAPRANRCMQCASELPAAETGAEPVCGECLTRPPAFDATFVAADYAPPVDQLVLALKFGNRLALAPLFAHMLRDALLNARRRDMRLPALLSAVPLSAQHLSERGFNQALEIAKPFSQALGIKLDARLGARLRDTRAQSLLPVEERRKNIRGAFALAPHAVETVRGLHIGVVDDVITTGATLHEWAATLKRYGAARVTNFVFARTQPRP